MSDYQNEVIEPGDALSELAHVMCQQSHQNCQAVHVIARAQGFRGPSRFVYKRGVLREMMAGYMVQAAGCDGAGQKPLLYALVNSEQAMMNLGNELPAMVFDDHARNGDMSTVILNQVDIKRVTPENIPLLQAFFLGYGKALKRAGVVNIAGETAIMKWAITSPFAADTPTDIAMTWGGSCLAISRPELMMNGPNIRPDMPVYAFVEKGYRCNGGSNIIAQLRHYGATGAEIMAHEEARRLLAWATIPSTVYAPTVCKMLGWHDDGSYEPPLVGIEGIAHITGGGVWGKFVELLPDGVGAVLDTMPAPHPMMAQLQRWSRERGISPISDYACYGDFHGGSGMLIICTNEVEGAKLIGYGTAAGIETIKVGHTVADSRRVVQIQSRFMDGAMLDSTQRSA